MTVASRAAQPTTTRSLPTMRNIRPRLRGRERSTDRGTTATVAATSAKPDPRVGDGIEHVGDEVAEDDGDGAENRDRQDDRVVPREDRVHREAAHAWEREHVLHHN